MRHIDAYVNDEFQELGWLAIPGMTTIFLTPAQLDAIYGAGQVADATIQTDAEVQSVIDAVNDTVDGRARSGYAQSGYPNAWTADLPDAAVSMLRKPAAALAFQLLYGQASPESIVTAAAQAERHLDAIAQGKVLLPPLPEVVDDPTTPEDESATGAAFGSAPRLMGRRQLGGW